MRRACRPGWAPRLAAVLSLLLLQACSGGGASSSGAEVKAAAAGPVIQVLSSSAERVSGNSVLIDIAAADASTATTVTLNGDDVSTAFKPDPRHPGHRLGLLEGLRLGSNALVASQGGGTSSATVTNYPLSGPVISGPHESPFVCQTDAFKLPDGSSLGTATDADCNAPPRVAYLYLQRGAAELVPWSPLNGDTSHLPDDTALTTTTAGLSVPFVVRLETRVINRGIYQSAVLHDPSQEAVPSPLAPPRGWNRRLIAVQGFGCSPGWNVQGASQGSALLAGLDLRLLNPTRLGEGYALVTNTLQHGTNNCNVLLAAETAMMSKEQFIKVHGVPDFSVTAGCSGGSYGSLQLADMVPGLYDGVLSACTYPDVLTSTVALTDARLLAHYWRVTDPDGFSDDQKVAVSGFKSLSTLAAALTQAGRIDPVSNRIDVPGYQSGQWSPAVPLQLRFDPATRPGGARPTIYDIARSVYGVDPVSGYAYRPYDNTGVQYGLQALRDGAITPEQFVRLNEQIGGNDQNADYIGARSVGNLGAITRAQQVGLLLNGGGGLASVPVFDISGIYHEDADYHLQWYHHALRERLIKAAGNADHMVMWQGASVPTAAAWATFIAWVQAYKADAASGTQREKVLRNKPAAAVDGCWADTTTFIAEKPSIGHSNETLCNAMFPTWTSPRLVAGSPLAADILRCKLKTPSESDYAVSFSADQWRRLLAAFPSGVCDWTQPGQGQAAFVPNASVGPSPLNQVFDPLH